MKRGNNDFCHTSIYYSLGLHLKPGSLLGKLLVSLELFVLVAKFIEQYVRKDLVANFAV